MKWVLFCLTCCISVVQAQDVILAGGFNINEKQDLTGYINTEGRMPVLFVRKIVRDTVWAGTYNLKDVFVLYGPMPGKNLVWTMFSASKDKPIAIGYGMKVRSMTSLVKLDCRGKRLRTLQFMAFDGYWSDGKVLYKNTTKTDWEYPLPGTVNQETLDINCKR